MIIGNLTSDPVLRSTQDGKKVATYTVAVNERYNGQDHTTFYNCSSWESRAEPIMAYLKKGSKVYCSGKISARAYKAKDGTERVSLDLKVDECEFLSPKNNVKDNGMTRVENDDLPF